MAKKKLFLTFRIFSAMGGIERVCRIFGKALYEINNQNDAQVQIYSMYDTGGEIDTRYFPTTVFKAFGIKRNRFIFASIKEGIKSDMVIISHVNLLPVAFCIKLFSPKTKLVLIAHGIEVWKRFPLLKRIMLNRLELILSVSTFTRDKMIALNQLDAARFSILNNCLDPFLPAVVDGPKDPVLMERYGFKQDDIILMTISRLSSKENYKNCDKVLLTIKELAAEYPQLKYLIVGAYDMDEKNRIEKMSKALGVEKAVVITGFIPDSDFSTYYNMADIFIMLSEREGFGIVFIEAMYYGKPVIGANRGGIPDALVNGKLGVLVDPSEIKTVNDGIKKILSKKTDHVPAQTVVIDHFGYSAYKNKLQTAIGK